MQSDKVANSMETGELAASQPCAAISHFVIL